MNVAVVGAGISGLSAAFRFLELASEKGMKINVVVYEAGSKPGGVISTFCVDNLILEEGPDSVFIRNDSIIKFSEKVGIRNKIIPTRENNRFVYIYFKNKLRLLPEGFYLMAPTKIGAFLKSDLFSLKGKLRICMEPLIPPKKDEKEESLYSFALRRFGKEALERAVQPLVSGIYTADPKELSLNATMPQFIEFEKKHGSVIRGLWRTVKSSRNQSGPRYNQFVSFKGGMKTLVDSVMKALPKRSIRFNRTVTGIERSGKVWRVITKEEGVQEFDGVVLAIPAPRAAYLLRDCHNLLSQELLGIKYLSSSVVNLVYRREAFRDLPRSFGVLVPSVERKNIIAISFLSEKFEGRAPHEFIIVRCFAGGQLSGQINELDDDEVVEICMKEVSEMLKVTEEAPVFKGIKRHGDIFPLYGIGHLDRVKRIHDILGEIKGLSLAGNAYRGVGVPECINSGFSASEKVFYDIV